MAQCYVCLEACEGEHSPCECKIPVHAECLEKYLCSDGRLSCSVCKSPLEYVDFEIDIENTPDVVIRTPNRQPPYVYLCVLIYYFFIYCALGWIGKATAMLVSGSSLDLDADFFDMCTSEHMTYAMLAFMFIVCIYVCIIKQRERV